MLESYKKMANQNISDNWIKYENTVVMHNICWLTLVHCKDLFLYEVSL